MDNNEVMCSFPCDATMSNAAFNQKFFFKLLEEKEHLLGP